MSMTHHYTFKKNNAIYEKYNVSCRLLVKHDSNSLCYTVLIALLWLLYSSAPSEPSERFSFFFIRKIIQQFLGALIDSDDKTGRPPVPLPKSPSEPSGSSLSDALKVLACKQMKIMFTSDNKTLRATRTSEDQEAIDQDPEADEQKGLYEVNLLKRNLTFHVSNITGTRMEASIFSV